ncbi:MAG: ABC transporter permease [Candidatus Limimorpha sp.]
MFNRDTWVEIFVALKRNKLRTTLTGFAVSWGIFILIILLSAGNGLKNGVNSNFAKRAKNTYNIYSSSTELPFKGHKADRLIVLNNNDIRLLENMKDVVEDVSPVYSTYGTVVYGDKSRQIEIECVNVIFKDIDGIEVLEGRFFNENDMKTAAKVVVIDNSTRDELMRKSLAEKNSSPYFMNIAEEDGSIIGETVSINSINYTVIGVFNASDYGGSGMCFIPFTTAQRLYNFNEYYRVSFTVKGLDTEAANTAFQADLRRKLASIHEFSPDDQRAVWIHSQMLNALETERIFNTIGIFIWIIGIAMLISGIVGVTNIMRITVRERTNEIGIRMAIGAKPRSILMSIIIEALVITIVFGYIGMFLGIAVTEAAYSLIKMFVSTSDENGMSVFLDPSADIRIILMATIVLVVSGLIAGAIPAIKAVKVKPIQAMNYR